MILMIDFDFELPVGLPRHVRPWVPVVLWCLSSRPNLAVPKLFSVLVFR